MRKSVWIGLLVLVASTFACKKVPLPDLPEGNDPIYRISGLANEDSLNLTVGRETVVMNHGVSEKNGILTYFGEMESVSENEKFRIEFIQNERPRKGNNTVVFQGKTIPFLVHEKGRFEFDFGGIGNQSNYLLLEDKNGNFVSTNELELNEFGFFTVHAKFSDFGYGVYDFEVKHGYRNQEIPAEYHAQGTNETILLTAVYPQDFHEWYIDGVLVGTGSVYEGAITDGIHRIRHRVIDSDGNESSSKSLVRFKGGKDFWDMKIKYSEEPDSKPTAQYNYGRVIVSMFKNDQWYSSEYAVSNNTANFDATNIVFVPNEGGERPLTAFEFDFSATLCNESASDSLVLSNVNGKFLVGLE